MRKCTVEKYGDTFRLLYSRGKRKAVFYDSDLSDESDLANRSEADEEHARLANNICRARGRVRELALCNEWNYFVTLTIDGRKQDRYCLKDYIRSLGFFFGNLGKKYSCKIQYLVIPEQHKNGAWHCHGLLFGLPQCAFCLNDNGYLTLPDYNRRFGFIGIEPIRDKCRVAAYITKYITKDFSSEARKRGEHLFYSSQGLKGKEVLFAFEIPEIAAADYENDFCGISWRNRDTEIGKLLAEYLAAYELHDFKAADEMMCRVQELVYNRTNNFDTLSDDKLLQIMSLNPQSSSSLPRRDCAENS